MSLPDADHICKPFQYPWACDAWLTQQRTHWLPEEVPLADDVKDRRNKLPWLDEILNGVEHTNVFENRATEYPRASTRGAWEKAFD